MKLGEAQLQFKKDKCKLNWSNQFLRIEESRGIQIRNNSLSLTLLQPPQSYMGTETNSMRETAGVSLSW